MKRFGVTRIGTVFGRPRSARPSRPTAWRTVNVARAAASRALVRRTTSPGRRRARRAGRPGRQVGELVVRAGEPWSLNVGYYKMPEATVGGVAQRLVPHRRRLQARRRRLVLLRRPHQRRDPPARREHLVVRGRVVRQPAPEGGASPRRSPCRRELSEDEIKICVVVTGREEFAPAELIEFLGRACRASWFPRYVELVDALPKTQGTLRTRKFELRDSLVNGNTWDRDAN